MPTTRPTDGTLGQCIYIECIEWTATPNHIKHRYNAIPLHFMCPLTSPLSTDALHTVTPTTKSRIIHIYRRQMDPSVNLEEMP